MTRFSLDLYVELRPQARGRVRTRDTRIQARRGVLLKNIRLKEATQKRYQAQLARFRLTLHTIQVEFSPHDVDFDESVAERYVQHLYEAGRPRSWASDFLCGIQDAYPRLRGCLRHAWRSLTAWEICEPALRAPPLPRSVLAALCGLAVAQGRHDLMVFFLLGFHCYLRPSELLNLCPTDIAIHSDLSGVIALENTKTSRRKRALEHVDIEDPVVALLVLLLKQQPRATTRIFDFNYATVRAYFRDFMGQLGISVHGFRLYSLRRGGAAWDFRNTGSIDRSLHRGRWGSYRAASLYLTDAKASAVRLSFEADVVVLLRQYEARFASYICQVGGAGIGTSLVTSSL